MSMEKRELDYLTMCILKIREFSLTDEEKKTVDTFHALVGVAYKKGRFENDAHK